MTLAARAFYDQNYLINIIVISVHDSGGVGIQVMLSGITYLEQSRAVERLRLLAPKQLQ